MLSRQHRRKNPDDLGGKLRRRFYKGAAIATTAYVTLSLVRFHGEYSYLPYALAVIWAVFLLCYTTFKEVLRWSDVGDEEEVYHGEFWAGLVVAGMGWMIGWNIIREWAFNAPSLPLPEDYQAATIETIVLYTFSIISSLLYKHRAETEQLDRENLQGEADSAGHSTQRVSDSMSSPRAVNNRSNRRAAVKNRQIVIRQGSPRVVRQDSSLVVRPAKNQDIEVVLIKSSKLRDKNPAQKND